MVCNGGSSETASIQLPIHLDQLRLKTGSLKGQEWATGVSKGELRGLRGAYAQVQMLGKDGDVVLNVDNMRFIDLANDQGSSSSASQSGKAYSSPYNRLVWRPDIRTLNTAQINTVLSDKTGTFTRLSKIFDLLGHADPDLRILQVGTEEGAAGQAILQTLTGSKGIKRYREYVMSYASKAQLPSEKSEFRDVNHALLDMEEDPLDQGFNPIYDVVVSVRAVQGSEKAQRFLENCKKLLRPGGTLVLLEPSEINWEAPVVQAGLELSAMVAADTDSTLLLATLPHQEAQPEDRSSLIHLLHGTSGMPLLLDRMAHELKGRGLSTKIMGLEDAKSIPAKSRVIAFLDQENLLLDADQHRIELFQHLAANAASMVWLTSCGIVKARNPDAAFVSGLLRTLGTENPSSQFLFMDIDADNFQPPEPEQELDDLVRCIADQELGLHAESSEANRDRAWQDGCMWISRLVPDDNLHDYADAVPAPDDQELELVPLSSQGPLKAAFRTPGILTSLYFKPYVELLKPLQKHEIDVKVLAVGLNWKDLGLCTGRFDLNNFSNEYVGIVTRRGAEVAHVAVGDRVYGMGKGHFGNYTRVPAAIAQRLPFEVDTVDAATMPLVYMTAVYAFEHVTRLRKGQKVLIQSASGGLGLAAIQLAQAKGAEIYATVGNAEKACFLTDEMGIPPTRIFSSRDQADVQRMINATLHGGFDVILSNAQGDMLYESIKSLAPLGHLIDVGRMDVTGSKNVALELFQKSASFTSFDLGLVIDRDLELAGELMQSVHEHFTAGRIRPVRPHTTFDISQLDQALLRFSKGTHIGKLVVTYLDAESMVKKHDSVAPVSFDPEARYILVGGLSELGRSIVRWMSERGARDMVVWSRSGSKNVNAESSALIQDLARSGVSVRPVTCDVSNLEQVKQAVQDASSDRPVRGVFNYAVSYQDIGFDKMTAEMFHGGMAAKVIGSRNLHEATLSMPLDFFTMVSSFGTVVAFPTQSTYLAANNWMEYFARYRRRCGLPASTVSLGFIADVGPLAGDVATVNLVTRAKIELVTAAQVLRMLEPGFKTSVSQSGEHQQWFGQSDDPLSEANIVTGCDPAVLATMKREEPKGLAGLIPRWHRDARALLILRAVDDACRHHAGSDAAKALGDNAADLSPTAQLRQQFQAMLHRLNEKSSDEVEVAKALAFVMQAIRDTVAGMLFIDPSAVNVTGTIADHGIDSLLAAEFRNWLQGAFGKNISMLDLMDARTRIDTLAQSILEGAVEA
jgi:NADPH:quinone reductase-like Zn-dependent oxidoreductase/acyl carrier protein